MKTGSVIAFILPKYPWKRSFEEVGVPPRTSYTKGDTTLMPSRVVYEKAMAFYFAVHTAMQQTTFV